MLYPLFQAQLDRCDQQNHQSFHVTAKNKCYLVHGLKRNYEKNLQKTYLMPCINKTDKRFHILCRNLWRKKSKKKLVTALLHLR
jgi:hypothetical protein